MRPAPVREVVILKRGPPQRTAKSNQMTPRPWRRWESAGRESRPAAFNADARRRWRQSTGHLPLGGVIDRMMVDLDLPRCAIGSRRWESTSIIEVRFHQRDRRQKAVALQPACGRRSGG